MAVTLDGYDPVSIQPWLLRVYISMTLFAAVFVALRLVSRRLNRQSLWWDDWMVIFSMAWLCLTIGAMSAMYHFGVGKHQESLTGGYATIVLLAKLLLVVNTFYIWNLVWSKLAVLLLYYRIFQFGCFTKVACAVAAFVVAWGITMTSLTFGVCVPIAKQWDATLPGYCLDREAIRLANGMSTILSDVVILCLPLPQIWRLHSRIWDKIELTVVFMLGSFVVFASTYRMTRLVLENPADVTYTIAPSGGWTVIEIAAGIVSACLPTLSPVVGILLDALSITGKDGILSKLRAHSLQSGSVNPSGSGTNATVTGRQDDANLKTADGRKVKGKGHFYRLSELEEPQEPRQGQDEGLHLTPVHGYERLVLAEAHGGASNEVPLESIHVRTEFIQQTKRRSATSEIQG